MSIPIILHVPHASRHIPSHVRRGIELKGEALEFELDRMTDSYTDNLASVVQECLPHLDVTVIASPVSRLVVDVERFPDDREVMNAVGMGVIYTKTHDQKTLRSVADRELVDEFFTPYAADFTQAVDEALSKWDKALILDLHSYPSIRLPYELVEEDEKRPEVCLGTDAYHTPGWLVEIAEEAFREMDIAHNSPFSGTYIPLKHYGTDPRVMSLMLEIRRDTYMDELTVELDSGFNDLCDRLAALIERVTSSILTSR